MTNKQWELLSVIDGKSASGTPAVVYASTQTMMHEVADTRLIIWSRGGGVTQNVSAENMKAFTATVKEFS